MNHQQKIEWMAVWASKNKVTLDLESTCGFGRECVGILADGLFPDYAWDDNYDDSIWTPEDAYHKHQCVAVLGRGEQAEDQLYLWLKWFDDNGYVVETGAQAVDPSLGAIAYMLGKHRYCRMVKKEK